MLLLGISLNAALIFSVTTSAIPLDSRALSSTGATTDVYRSAAQRTDLQRRKLPPSLALLSPKPGPPSDSSSHSMTVIDHEIDCFPTGARLPAAVAEDCKIIIDSIILALKDPLRIQTWGFTDDVENNLSEPGYKWAFESCFIRVKNLDENQVDKFSPVDVANVAQRIVQQCVVETKEPIGGNADIGRLGIPLSFYVVVAGKYIPVQTRKNTTVLSLPSNELQTLESRASRILPQENTISIIPTQGLQAGERYPIHCFNLRRLTPASASDCAFIINDIILRLPNPMLEQSFGYTDAVDINLSEQDNGLWVYGQCAVFVKNMDTTSRDRFRYLDVALTAQRIVEKCVEGSKYAIGGTGDIGTIEDNFYVGVGGLERPRLGNDTVLGLASETEVSLPSGAIPASTAVTHRESVTERKRLDKRSSNLTSLLHVDDSFGPPVRCLQPGMPAARKINMQDCTNAAIMLLHDPRILVPQPFTTETTGGIGLPFVQHNGSCYIMMDTESALSISENIPVLKMVYWALEIMLKCISGREQGFGGVRMLDANKEIFVSVTGVDATFVGDGLASLADEGASAAGLESSSLQITGLGQV